MLSKVDSIAVAKEFFFASILPRFKLYLSFSHSHKHTLFSRSLTLHLYVVSFGETGIGMRVFHLVTISHINMEQRQQKLNQTKTENDNMQLKSLPRNSHLIIKINTKSSRPVLSSILHPQFY